MAHRSVRGRLGQLLIVAAGSLLAGVMVLLGFWQLDVYHRQGAAAAAQRAAEPAVELRSVAPAGSSVRDGYGRTVRFEGTYLPELQRLLPLPGRPEVSRVLGAVRQSDGSIVAVVRGIGADPAAPPLGSVTQTGILLPSEVGGSTPDGQLTAVELPVLAQEWPGPLIDGFVTLSSTDAAQQGLQHATIALPDESGRLRNGAYALQWWVFAAFTAVMAVRMARESRVGLVREPT